MPTGRTKAENAMTMLKSDHQKVKELFEKFEKSKNPGTCAWRIAI